MSEEKIKDFAIKNGFQDVKEIGKYNEYVVYAPIFTDGKARKIGYPQYILIKDEEISLKIDISLEMTKELFQE